MPSVRQSVLTTLGAGRVMVYRAQPSTIGPPFLVAAVVDSSREERSPYHVDLRSGIWTCTCGRTGCAHVAAIQFVTGHPSPAAKEKKVTAEKEQER